VEASHDVPTGAAPHPGTINFVHGKTKQITPTVSSRFRPGNESLRDFIVMNMLDKNRYSDRREQ
jgi:hypothetical protein